MSSNTSEALEMYIKTVYDLEKNGERARTKEIARKLGVKEPSVTEMLQKLKRKSFVKYKRYHGATLTSKGRRLAKDLTGKHLTLRKFLNWIGVEESTAEKDACEIEHTVSSETIEKLRTFLRFLEESPRKPPKWFEHYNYFLKTGKHPECERQEASKDET